MDDLRNPDVGWVLKDRLRWFLTLKGHMFIAAGVTQDINESMAYDPERGEGCWADLCSK